MKRGQFCVIPLLLALAAPASALTTFGPARPVTTNAHTDVCGEEFFYYYCNDEMAPAVAADDNGTIVVAWASLIDIDGHNIDNWRILFVRSTDGGATWSPAAYL